MNMNMQHAQSYLKQRKIKVVLRRKFIAQMPTLKNRRTHTYWQFRSTNLSLEQKEVNELL